MDSFSIISLSQFGQMHNKANSMLEENLHDTPENPAKNILLRFELITVANPDYS